MAKTLYLTGDAAADTLLTEDANALVDRHGARPAGADGEGVQWTAGDRAAGWAARLDVAAIAAADEDEFVAAVLRAPGDPPLSRGDGQAGPRGVHGAGRAVRRASRERLGRGAGTGAEVVAAVRALPGFGRGEGADLHGPARASSTA